MPSECRSAALIAEYDYPDVDLDDLEQAEAWGLE